MQKRRPAAGVLGAKLLEVRSTSASCVLPVASIFEAGWLVVVERAERRSSSSRMRKRKKAPARPTSVRTSPPPQPKALIASPHRVVPTSDRLSSPSFAAALLLQVNQHDHQARLKNAYTKRSDPVCTASDPVWTRTRRLGRTLCASPPSSFL